VRLVKGIGRFWYDFVVGDDWKIAAAVATTMAAGAVVAAAASGDPSWLAPVLGAALALAFTISLLVDVRGFGSRRRDG
jgi:hypothetical protein